MLHSPSQGEEQPQELVLSMEDLMRLNPLIERKMSRHRKQRYAAGKGKPPQHPVGDFPQIREEEEF